MVCLAGRKGKELLIVNNRRGVSVSFLFYYPEFGIVEHYLLFSVQIKLYCSNRIMFGAFHFYYFAKTKFLVLDLLTYLQIGSITGNKISRRDMLFCLLSGYRR